MTTAVVAVRTTGIYCRDTCSARPLERNRVSFTSAIAAQAAGYRPCLRCRPDRRAQFADAGGDVMVERALALIADGALDDSTEDALGARLGMSGRHLRRLCLKHVGATPAHIARARRAHFARRLLDETDLRLSEVASASGFASTRQFNRVMLDVFGFAPAVLRAKRRNAGRLVADGGLALDLPYDAPYAFDALLGHRRLRAIPGVEHVGRGLYRRTITSCGNPGVIEVSDAGDGQHLRLVAHVPSLGTLIDDVAHTRRVFALDVPGAAETPLSRDPLLADAVAAYPGVRPPGAWDPFETAIRIIVGQHVSVAGASTLTGRIARAFGAPVAGLAAMDLSHTFPTAGDLASTAILQLRDTGLTTARAETIRSFARAYADSLVRIDRAVVLDDLLGSLRQLPGIGPWTADMIALFAAGQPDAFPSGDLGLRKSAAQLFGRNAPFGEPELEAVSQRWRPHRALAAMYLWLLPHR